MGRGERDPEDPVVEPLLAPLDGRAGPARRLSPAVSQQLVRSAIEAALDFSPGEAEEPAPAPAR